MPDILKSSVFYILPHHFLTRIIYYLTRLEWSIVPTIIDWFIKTYSVNMTEAKIKDTHQFKSFNAFFTRELLAGIRPINQTPQQLTSPVDGTVSQAMPIQAGNIFQAKNHSYSVEELLGGDPEIAKPFINGQFATIYLSPRDYHRIHMPYDGQLTTQIHIPGRLFSVAPFTVNTIPKVFARNERVVCLFETDKGPMAMVLVGAMNVAAIETVWDGLITPPKGKHVATKTYKTGDVTLAKGDEMGRFNMGSTVILLHANADWQWKHLQEGLSLQLGQLITH